MESLFDRAPRLRDINECVANASTLAEHLTKLVGGVKVESSIGAHARVSARSLVPAVALILGAGARRLIDRKQSGGLRVKTVETAEGGFSIRFHTPYWGSADITHCVSAVAPLLKQDRSWTVTANADCVELRSNGDRGAAIAVVQA